MLSIQNLGLNTLDMKVMASKINYASQLLRASLVIVHSILRLAWGGPGMCLGLVYFASTESRWLLGLTLPQLCD